MFAQNFALRQRNTLCILKKILIEILFKYYRDTRKNFFLSIWYIVRNAFIGRMVDLT